MKDKVSPIIQVSELFELVNKLEPVIVFAGYGKEAEEFYKEKHLKDALFIELNSQLSAIDNPSKGGRHPLPSIEQFGITLSKLGISNDSHVIIYDDKNGSNSAARFWWMLKSVGHNKAQVINGGLQEAEKRGYPINSDKVFPKLGHYEASNWKLPIASIDEVEKASKNNTHLIIDVRAKDRYDGIIEPIDLIAGHIPGAVNTPLTENLGENGLFKSPKNLKEKYTTLFNNRESKNIIVHCGSGVTACHTLLAIAYAGMEIPKLYVGSWSEWSRNKKSIATNK